MVAACSGASERSRDGSVIDEPDAAAEDAAAPDLDASQVDAYLNATVALPLMTPCPPGWREVPGPVPDLAVCDPWPAGGQATCPDGQFQLPGGGGCQLIGPPCPAGDWADDLPTTGTIVYVLPGANGGTGTRTAPYGSIRRAAQTAAPGTVIALAKGRYEEELVLDGVTLWGACVTQTTLVDPATQPINQLTITGGGLRNLTSLVIYKQGNAVLPGATPTLLENVVLKSDTMRPVLRSIGDVTLEDVAIRMGAPTELAVTMGANPGAAPVQLLRRVSIDGRVNIDDRVVFELSDATITGMVRTYLAGAFRASRAVLGSLQASRGDAVVFDHVRAGSLHVISSASIAIDHSLFQGGSIQVGGSAICNLRDVVVSDTAGYGISVTPAGSGPVVIDRVLVAGARQGGFLAFNAGNVVRASNLTVLATVELSCAATTCPSLRGYGIGVGAYSGASLELSRFLISDNALVGVQVGPMSAIDLSDGTIRLQPIGANVQEPTFDPRRLAQRVIYQGNGINLDSFQLALPPPPPPIVP